ncbi:MAG: 16S rRNA (cytosine(967)-C(5))-methyltransferase, partial [Gemmatimonadota bacterium]|nr:16S rRNA (cytosine(967)-C(5))-methyltransferase [Gemmatimonadota bacterium]
MNAAGNSRRAALDILRAVRAGKIFDQALDENVQDLEPTDRKLAHEIAAGVLRSRDALDKTIQPYLKKPSSKTAYDIRDILRIGTYQMVFLDRIPDYAAVTSAV